MRIGEFYQILKQATSENGTLQTNGESIYNGQVYKIKDFRQKARLIVLLDKLGLMPASADPATIQLIAKHENDTEYWPENVIHDQIVTLFTVINPELPIIVRTVEAFSPEQDEQILNIKLPDGVDTFKKLEEYNKHLEGVFKKFGITDHAKILGFDAGSEWYQVLIESAPMFKYIVGAAGIAWFVLDARQKWYDSEQTRLTVSALKKSDPKITDKKHVSSLVQELISEEAKKLVAQLGSPDNRQEAETVSMVEGGVKAMVEEIDRGTEFHLSLNPPEYLAESRDGRLFRMNYSSIPKIEKNENTKEIAPGVSHE